MSEVYWDPFDVALDDSPYESFADATAVLQSQGLSAVEAARRRWEGAGSSHWQLHPGPRPRLCHSRYSRAAFSPKTRRR